LDKKANVDFTAPPGPPPPAGTIGSYNTINSVTLFGTEEPELLRQAAQLYLPISSDAAPNAILSDAGSSSVANANNNNEYVDFDTFSGVNGAAPPPLPMGSFDAKLLMDDDNDDGMLLLDAAHMSRKKKSKKKSAYAHVPAEAAPNAKVLQEDNVSVGAFGTEEIMYSRISKVRQKHNNNNNNNNNAEYADVPAEAATSTTTSNDFVAGGYCSMNQVKKQGVVGGGDDYTSLRQKPAAKKQYVKVPRQDSFHSRGSLPPAAPQDPGEKKSRVEQLAAGAPELKRSFSNGKLPKDPSFLGLLNSEGQKAAKQVQAEELAPADPGEKSDRLAALQAGPPALTNSFDSKLAKRKSVMAMFNEDGQQQAKEAAVYNDNLDVVFNDLSEKQGERRERRKLKLISDEEGEKKLSDNPFERVKGLEQQPQAFHGVKYKSRGGAVGSYHAVPALPEVNDDDDDDEQQKSSTKERADDERERQELESEFGLLRCSVAQFDKLSTEELIEQYLNKIAVDADVLELVRDEEIDGGTFRQMKVEEWRAMKIKMKKIVKIRKILKMII